MSKSLAGEMIDRRTVALILAPWLLAALPDVGASQEFDQRWLSANNVAAIPRAELNAITQRGLLLAEYDFAAWHASDVILALKPREELVRAYLARRGPDDRWDVVFGRLTPRADTFRIAFRARQKEPGSLAFTTYEMRPPSADVGYFASAARAFDLCKSDFGQQSRPYNAMVVPVANGPEWYVYLVPAPTAAGFWPHGGDVRFRVSADGRTITERRRMHNAVLEFPPPKSDSAGRVLVAGFHTAVLDDRPEDTDVFHVMRREPRVKEIIATQSFFFVIDTLGSIMAYNNGRRPPPPPR